jgi:NosR/NirI family nitrous oxide reductase transcriptional regulator
VAGTAVVKRILQWLMLLAPLAAAPGQPLAATAYEAPLPAQLSNDPDLCAWVPCAEVLAGAESFSARKGRPSYVEAYRSGPDGRKLLGYVFLSTDVVDIPAYSGKPVVTLIGMDTAGIITGIRIIRHSEPILLVGIPEEELTKFTRQYVGKHVGTKIEVGRPRDGESFISVDVISGATVTVVAENQVILRSGYEIARQVGIVQAAARPPARYAADDAARDWATLVGEGSAQRLTVSASDVGAEDQGQPYMDMYFGLLNAPAIGISVLGEDNYRRLMAELADGEQAIFIAANGSGSFKGSGFVRGGIFDRIQVAQEIDTFTFRDSDYRNLYDFRAAGAPSFRESGIFIIRGGGFSAAYPWSLVFLANRVDRQTGERSFVTFDREYWLPAVHLEGGRPEYRRPEPAWMRLWRDKFWELGGFALMLGLAALLFVNRDHLVRASRRKDKTPLTAPKYVIWSVSVVVIGGYAMAQPSITHVLTWFHSLVYQWRWELFLSDPYIFIFWWFTIITTFVWGRGMFCGWLCPYGAFNEIVFKLVGATSLRRYQFALPKRWHDRLKWLKYLIFAGLLGVSFYSMALAERLAEIEPFKTTFLLGAWNRSWPFVAYWSVLLLAAALIERPFCKYLCPLGAGLAVPSTFRFIGLKRKSECTTCAACARGCSSLAIDAQGRIDQRECLMCLDCMVMYYDTQSCPPLSAERKARLKAGLPLTPINAQGYFEPLVPATTAVQQRRRASPAAWLRSELLFHVFPWDRNFTREIFAIRAVAVMMVVVVSVAWTLTATSRIGPAVMLGWWLGWSVYEIMSRMRYKPRVKDGPWWGQDYRPATPFDMVAYVATKNLLIAATLFLLLNALGVLSLLQSIPGLEWLYK